jgi:hypothetical protein
LAEQLITDLVGFCIGHECFSCEQVQHGPALHGPYLTTVKLFSMINACQVEQRRHDVPHMEERMIHTAFIGFPARTFYYQWRFDATFGGKCLKHAAGRHAGLEPARPKLNKGIFQASIFQAVIKRIHILIGLTRIDRFRMAVGAVIREKKDHGIVVFADLFQVIKDLLDLLVHLVYHRRIHFHVAGGFLSLL